MITDIDWNKYFNDLFYKANIDLLNTNKNIDIVVDYKINSDGSWYRKYKSGWLEQGGYNPQNTSLVNFSKPFRDNKYTLVGCSNGDQNRILNLRERTTTSFRSMNFNTDSASDYSWYACGQGV